MSCALDKKDITRDGTTQLKGASQRKILGSVVPVCDTVRVTTLCVIIIRANVVEDQNQIDAKNFLVFGTLT